MSGILHTKWGIAKLDEGYFRILSGKTHYGKYLHRVIYEEFWGVKLPSQIIIHHKNGNKLDNCILNLEAMTMSEHKSHHNQGNQIWVGKKHLEETKQKMSEAHKGKILSDETKARISKNKTGKPIATNTSGYLRVSKSYTKNCKQGFTWVYCYIEDGKHKRISSVDIQKLKEKVISKGLLWREL